MQRCPFFWDSHVLPALSLPVISLNRLHSSGLSLGSQANLTLLHLTDLQMPPVEWIRTLEAYSGLQKLVLSHANSLGRVLQRVLRRLCAKARAEESNHVKDGAPWTAVCSPHATPTWNIAGAKVNAS